MRALFEHDEGQNEERGDFEWFWGAAIQWIDNKTYYILGDLVSEYMHTGNLFSKCGSIATELCSL